MTTKPEIEKLRILHDLQNEFDVPDSVTSVFQAQLSAEDQSRIERFVGGFKIEDWFQWIFSAMPWAVLIHGLDQQQFPLRSKEKYQVPDFLALVETTALSHPATQPRPGLGELHPHSWRPKMLGRRGVHRDGHLSHVAKRVPKQLQRS